MDINQVFCSAGVNPRSHCLSVSGSKDFVVYASEAQLVLESLPQSSSEHGRVVDVSVQHHHMPVTVVKRLKAPRSDDTFISGSVDGLVHLWQITGDRLEHYAKLEGCADSVESLCGVARAGSIVAVASYAGVQSGLIVWWIKNVSEITQSELQLGGNAFALTVDCQELESGSVLLAVGSSQRNIELYSTAPGKEEFGHVLSMTAHTDCIHSVSFNGRSDSLLLASAGQEKSVKLWRIQLDDSQDDPKELSVTKNKFTIPGEKAQLLSIDVEAVMAGHEDRVHSTEWNSTGEILATSSSDKTTILWKKDNGLWSVMVRLGIVGGQAAGFFCACFSHDGKRIVASSYFGGLHAWVAGDEERPAWQPMAMAGGHVGEVRDVCWDRNGKYLVSVGKDQTARIYASNHVSGNYLELARPQVHGHDMQCVATVNSACYVSGAKEKTFRAFQAPRTFADSLCTISGLDREKTFAGLELAQFGARVPALGLSNKAVDGEEVPAEDVHGEEAGFQATHMELKALPTEDCLQQNTLWPELHKLNGRGFEVYAIAVNPSSTVLATACKASQQDYAAIELWSVADWSKKAVILGHQLTVTQLEWSPDGQWLLSVSLDRCSMLYKESSGNVDGFDYNKVWSSTDEHSHVIWSCAWLNDSSHFATASRDLKVIVWNVANDGASPAASFKFQQPVTAVAAGSGQFSNVLACGLQDGSVVFLKYEDSSLKVIFSILNTAVNVDTAVLRLRFHPDHSEAQLLAYAGANGKTRIIRLSLNRLHSIPAGGRNPYALHAQRTHVELLSDEIQQLYRQFRDEQANTMRVALEAVILEEERDAANDLLADARRQVDDLMFENLILRAQLP